MKFLLPAFNLLSLTVIVFLSTYVLTHAAKLEYDYTYKYEVAYENMVTEHEQQLIIGEMIQSQQAWERTADALRVAYGDEKAKANQMKLQLDVEAYELYVFMKILNRDFPGVANEVITEINQARLSELDQIIN